MKRKETCTQDASQSQNKHEATAAAAARVAFNAEALIGYFDSMAFARDTDKTEATLRHVLEIESTPLFQSLAALIVDVYYRQRAAVCMRDRVPYKQRHQNATMLSYKSRITDALTHGTNARNPDPTTPAASSLSSTDEDGDGATDSSSSGGGGGGGGSTTAPEDAAAAADDGEGGGASQLLSCNPRVIGTYRLGRRKQWRLCDDEDRKCIGRLRQFATWWFTNFTFAMLSICHREELVALTLPIENRVRAVCGFNTLVPWCMDLGSELLVEDAATENPTDNDAQAAHAYASCRYVRDGIISDQAALFAGFVCINAMHSADTCLPPPPPPLSATVNRGTSTVHCGIFQRASHADAASIAMHYNSERATRIGNLAMYMLLNKRRHTFRELQKHDKLIVRSTLEWLRSQIGSGSAAAAGLVTPATLANHANCIKGFLPQLLRVLEDSLTQ